MVLVACEPPPDAEQEPGSTQQATEVRAVLTEWGVQLDRSDVPAGEVVFHVRNEGEYEHTFEVERGDEEWETGRIPPGSETVLTAELAPGTYEVYCPIEDRHGHHQELGMETRLTVR